MKPATPSRISLSLTPQFPLLGNLWANLPDAKTAAVGLSVQLLEVLHQRWAILLDALAEADLDKTFYNPESGRTLTLHEAVALYAWHGQHHIGHLRLLVN